MKLGVTLIDKASKVCGSDAQLARRLGTKPPAISEMRKGKREISPETAALLADIAHEDARQAVIDAVIERNKTGPRAELIREILGKAAAAGVAAVSVISLSGILSIATTTDANATNCKSCSESASNNTHRHQWRKHVQRAARVLKRVRDWVTMTWGRRPHTPTPEGPRLFIRTESFNRH